MLLAFVALFSITRSWGRHLNELGVQMGLGAPPLFGRHDPRTPMAIAPAVVFALGAVLWGPRVASAAPWRRLVFGSVAAAGVWAVLLAVADGTTALVEPLTHGTGYFPLVARINSPGAFVDSFVERLAAYPVHVQGHPPGIVLFLWALGRAGLHGQWPAAATFVIAGASAAGAALIGVNEIAGERLARSAAPFLVLTPMAIWIATTADALWLGISAWGVALFVVAAERSGRMGDMWALAAGLLLGAALMMSYGIAPLGAVVALEVWWRAAVRQALIAATGVAAIAAAFAIFGFWWH
ncbi:MAG: hypothetical protein H0U16_04700, partial [Actinobacteria bacterium]|nr:hypothetical protein [Actinomycetota bacterium]